MTDEAPARHLIIRYAFLALPLSFAGLPLYVHMPDFYTRDFGIGIGVLGAILLAIRLFDAVQDPLIGYISDRTAYHRFRLVFFGVLILSIGMAGLSFGPQLSLPAPVWFAVFMILATTGFSLVTININMIGGFWKDDHAQRMRIAGWREAFGLIGLLLAAIMPTVFQNYTSSVNSYILLFWVFAVFMIGGSALFWGFSKRFERDGHGKSSSAVTGFAFFSILKSTERYFFAICFLSYLAASLPAVLVLFFIRDYLGAEPLTGLFLVLYFISGAAFMAGWMKLARYQGLYKTWFVSMVLAVVTFMGAVFLQPGDVVAYGVICVLSGMALGADLALPPSIIAGRITKRKTENQATQYYALLAFLPKVAMALAAGLSFLALGQAGFAAGAENGPGALHTLVMAYALMPCLIKMTAAFLLWRLIKKEGHNHENVERSTGHGITRVS